MLIFSHRASRHKHLGASKRHDRGSENHNFSWENYIFMSPFPPKCADGPAVSRRQTCPLINYTQPLCIHTRTRVCSSSSDCVHAHVHSRLRHGLPAEVSVVQQRGDGGRNKWVVAARLKLQDAADSQCKYYRRKDRGEKRQNPGDASPMNSLFSLSGRHSSFSRPQTH